jgi:hypothetical protein
MAPAQATGDPHDSLLSRVFARPSSTLGRVSAVALLVSVLLVIVNSAAVMPFTEAREGLSGVQWVVNAIIGGVLLAAGLVGLAAVVFRQERSWAVLLAIVLAAIALWLNLAGS